MGNCSGKLGRSACGSLGYAMPDAMHAKHVIVITDDLRPYPLSDWSIPETQVDQVVSVVSIGDPKNPGTNVVHLEQSGIGLPD